MQNMIRKIFGIVQETPGLISVSLLIVLYYLVLKPYSYWYRRAVPTGRIIPLFGDTFYQIFGNDSFGDMLQRMYHKLPHVRYIGCYQFTSPILVLRSPEIIKQLCVRDFDHFMDRKLLCSEKWDEIAAGTLFFLKGQKWKNMRSRLSPFFTSSKMKSIFLLMGQSAKKMMEHFLKQNQEILEVDLRDISGRFATNIIANAALGLQVDSLEDKNDDFYLIGREITDLSRPCVKFLLLTIQLSQYLPDLLRLSVFGEKIKAYFLDIVRNSIKMREEGNIKRADVLGLLIESRKGRVKEERSEIIKDSNFAEVHEQLEVNGRENELTDLEIACQAFIFFFAGSDTSAIAMAFMAYELALHPDIQAKLIEEIDSNRDETGSVSYETIMNMTYLDMVISETLRKWPSLMLLERMVTKPYTIQPELPCESSLHLNINDHILIPTYAIHHDPEVFESPEKFDPERFSMEKRKQINPYSYFPFGVGPRGCIGSRFALVEIKTVFFKLLSHFEIVPVEKTPVPIKICKRSFTLKSEQDLIVGLKRRACSVH